MNARLEAGPSRPSPPLNTRNRDRVHHHDNSVNSNDDNGARTWNTTQRTVSTTTSTQKGARWKGKGRAIDLDFVLDKRDEGSGGADGIVLPLTMVGSGFFDAAYTIPVRFGESQVLSLQVDTGSSDLWVAANTCNNAICKHTNGHVYDPSSSRPTDANFEIQYIQGRVRGPVVWETVELGGYSIGNQALAAASDVQDEPLSPHFSGILGLALPLNSIIASRITPTTNDTPDGAAFAANLFGITPRSSAPAAHFYSLSLARPDSKYPSSLLGIGRHPTEFIKDEKEVGKVKYISLLSERAGTLFWKTSVHAVDVWVNGEKRSVELGRGVGGAVFPTAVLDSGVPLLLTTSHIANGIYGAIGIGPGADGKYYVPCSTPLNVTITFENSLTIPLHPLDLTASSPTDFCTGLIQAADGVLGGSSSVGDMILGVPFLRNTYTVMTYTEPEDDGRIISAPRAPIRPFLGLLPLTDSVKALDEFNTVRVLNKPLPGGKTDGVDGNGGGAGQTGGAGSGGGKKGISVGIGVLIGVLGFFALCAFLFGVRWLTAKRRSSKNGGDADTGGPGGLFGLRKGNETSYELAAVRDAHGGLESGLSEDELRRMRYEAYLQRKTQEEQGEFGEKLGGSMMDGRYPSYNDDSTKVGRESKYEDPWDPTTALGWNRSARDSNSEDEENSRERERGDRVPSQLGQEGYALPDSPTIDPLHARHMSFSATPLLVPPPAVHSPHLHPTPPGQDSPHSHYEESRSLGRGSQSPRSAHSTLRNSYFPEDAGGLIGERTSMVGIGTAARGSLIDFSPGGVHAGSSEYGTRLSRTRSPPLAEGDAERESIHRASR